MKLGVIQKSAIAIVRARAIGCFFEKSDFCKIVYNMTTAQVQSQIWCSLENKGLMRVISRKILRDFCESHADSCDALYDWYRVSTKAEWHNLIDVQQIYPKAESVGNFTVFNIKGNRYRLVVDLVYVSQIIYIKYVLTHAEYDKDEWKHYPYF